MIQQKKKQAKRTRRKTLNEGEEGQYNAKALFLNPFTPMFQSPCPQSKRAQEE
jgi:hypothetical protein